MGPIIPEGHPFTSRGAPVKNVNRGGVKETTTSILGELQYPILNVIVSQGLTWFTPNMIKQYLEQRGFQTSSRRVFDAVNRLVKRGILVKARRGIYKLTEKAIEVLDKARILARQSYTRVTVERSRKTQGTREPRGLRGLVFDNVRGFTVSGFVGGDRGRVLLGGDLVFFDRVSYGEVGVVSGGGWLEGWGQVVKYFSCFEVGFSGSVVCGDRVEWRPPKGFVLREGVAGLRRGFREVLLRELAVDLRAVRLVFGVGGLVGALRRFLRLRSPWALEVLGGLCRAYGDVLGL